MVVLLYCHDSVSLALDPGELDFCLPHALTLAEAGTSLRIQRLGYLFCATFLSPQHELHLLLVNTLHKHLESDYIGRIALALDHLIQSPGHDLLAATQTRLRQLLSHASPIIRRKALYAVKALGRVDASILQRLAIHSSKRVRDADAAVAGASVAICEDLHKQHMLDDQHATYIYKSLLHYLKASSTPLGELTVQKFLRFYTNTGPSLQVLEAIRPVLRSGLPRSKATILECYKVIQVSRLEDLLSVFTPHALISPIQPYLTSGDGNDLFFSLSCLSCVDPELWAGIKPERPLVLDALEVERIVKLMGSSDPAIRRQTALVLHRVDVEIVRTRFEQLLEDNTSSPAVDIVAMLLELAGVLAGDDGAEFGQLLFRTLATLARSLLGPIIELVLSILRAQDESFARDAANAIFVASIAHESDVNPTFMVIVVSLVAEYSDSVSTTPAELLEYLARDLHLYTASIQEVILLAMLRAASQCDGPVPTAVERVKKLQEASGQHIRRRCQQYLRLVENKEQLRAVVDRAPSRSLPDLSASIEEWATSPETIVASTSRLQIETRSTDDCTEIDQEESTPTRPSIAKGLHGESSSSLISLDSPFLSDPSNAEPQGAFELNTFSQLWQNPTAWAARGWSAESSQDIVGKLRTLGGIVSVESTNTGTNVILKHVPVDMNGTVAMKLVDKSDIGGSLWQLKSDSQALQTAVKRLLEA
ncbi:ARM repeat-containing protein [Peniophora sp. CONT]|nr:ARM repeat-containing protein [Peniophora sp. CONT]